VETYRAYDGLLIAAHLAPGDPGIVYAHATGFCKEVWGPVIRRLPGRGVLALDQRGHGDSEVGPPPFDWWDLGRDVVAGVEAAGWARSIGVGHSSGGAALAMAELLRPGSFRALLLIEPIVFPPPYLRYQHLPLAIGAERRRASFPSRDAARAGLAGRGPFAGWVDEALDAYLDGGFEDRDGEWALKCAPGVEAEWYRTATLHGAWDRLGEIACPVVVVGGADSDSHPAAFLEELAGRLGDATVAIIEDAGHFVPMERPEVVAGMIGGLAEQSSRGTHPAE
jgi:pimeloyl-ACP methyl ester carboxylesterase